MKRQCILVATKTGERCPRAARKGMFTCSNPEHGFAAFMAEEIDRRVANLLVNDTTWKTSQEARALAAHLRRNV